MTSHVSPGNRASRQTPRLEATAAQVLPPAARLEASTAIETPALLERRRALPAGRPPLANPDLYPPCLPLGQYPPHIAVNTQIRQHSSRINKVASSTNALRQQCKIDRPTSVERSILLTYSRRWLAAQADTDAEPAVRAELDAGAAEAEFLTVQAEHGPQRIKD